MAGSSPAMTKRKRFASLASPRVCSSTSKNRPTGKSVFATKTCPAPIQKIFRFLRRANQFYQLAPFFPGKRGVGHRHERGMGCGGRGSVGAKRQRRAGSSCEQP